MKSLMLTPVEQARSNDVVEERLQFTGSGHEGEESVSMHPGSEQRQRQGADTGDVTRNALPSRTSRGCEQMPFRASK
jgi:hypothetical protein